MRRSTLACALFAVLAVQGAVVGTQPALASFSAAEHLFDFADERITESSGVAMGRTNPGVLFTHNDSGDGPRFFAVGPDGATLAAYTVAGASALDWEDMAAGPGTNGGSSLFFADIGDNLRTRRFLRIFEVAEPSVVAGAEDQVVPLIAVYEMVYSDGPHDAEGFFVTPDRQLAVITKELHGLSGLYLARPMVPGVPNVLQRVGTIALPLLQPVGASYAVTGADLSADGSWLAVTTYDRAFEWEVGGGDLAAAVEGPGTPIDLPAVAQREAIAYTPDGKSLVVTTEGIGGPVYAVRRGA